jgi:hypothetical protein
LAGGAQPGSPQPRGGGSVAQWPPTAAANIEKA